MAGDTALETYSRTKKLLRIVENIMVSCGIGIIYQDCRKYMVSCSIGISGLSKIYGFMWHWYMRIVENIWFPVALVYQDCRNYMVSCGIGISGLKKINGFLWHWYIT